MKVPFTISQNSITVFTGGAPHTVHDSSPLFNDLFEYLKREDHDADELKVLVSIPEKIAGQTYGAVTVGDDGNLYYKDIPIENAMAMKVLEVIEQGFPVAMWALFLSNLMSNPSTNAQTDMYRFMDHCSLPLTDDGHFLAYKRVDDDYKDCRTHKLDNSIGAIVTMDRSDVDDDSHVTCSHGLHFCSREYLSGFAGGHLMVVKINPRDVVSIPIEYQDAKGRCCRYEVIAEIETKDKSDVPNEALDAIESKVINVDFDSLTNDDADWSDDDDAAWDIDGNDITAVPDISIETPVSVSEPSGPSPESLVGWADNMPADVADMLDEDVDELIRQSYDADSELNNIEMSTDIVIEPIDPVETLDEGGVVFFHTKTGTCLTQSALTTLLENATSTRKLGEQLGIPKSTIQDWATKLKNLTGDKT